jgi:hypothetical protein
MRRAHVALVLALSGCHTWPSRAATNMGAPGRTIRVVTDDGRRRAVLEGAALVGDSVIGRLAETDTLGTEGWARLRPGTGDRTAIAVSAITRVEVRELDKRRTYAPLVVLGVATAVLVLLAVAAVATLGAGY